MRVKILIFLLAAGTLALYWPTRHFDSIDLDDPFFMTDTGAPPGLNWLSFERAMTGVTVANWHPVTSLSFLITHQFFGTSPEAEHLVNVLFHAANAALLFLLLFRLTGTLWPSAAVAAIFAWHPLRVESVCWISERKDVLFAFFMLLSLLGYGRYARDEASGSPQRNRDFALSLVFFILSFMCKAMVVTLPFLLLLLDYWPLQRSSRTGFRKLLIEKTPFFVLTIFFCLLTFFVQKADDAVKPLGELGLAVRLENAVLSYAGYLDHFLWPMKLAILYSYPKNFDIVQVCLATLLLLAISLLCVRQYARRPYLLIGWLWYLGTMVPVIGLLQVGSASMADRYTYITLIGPVIGVVWLVSEWAGQNRLRSYAAASLAGTALALCVVLTRAQMMCWQNTVTLFERTVAMEPGNARAQWELGMGLKEEGRLQQAAVRYRMAIAIDPTNWVAHYRLADCLRQEGHRREARAEYETAISDGDDLNDDIQDLNLAIGLARLGRYRESVSRLETALRINPHSTGAINALAWLLATCPDASIRDGTRAVELAKRACDMTGNTQALGISTLAAADAEAGRFDEAIATDREAITLGQQQGDAGLVKRNLRYLRLYLAHKACRENDE